MTPVDFVFATHNHQPVGNFDHVIEDAYARAYAPFLAALERHPGVRWVLHQPGLLWQWIESHHPDYLERVHALVRRGQVELMSGGFYEPILPAIPPADRHGQIVRSNAWIERRFGVRPRGAWLAERVWEPHLAETLADAAIDYTVLDDSHFKSAGITSAQLDGYWVTEENGRTLAVFPISQALRYAIPFRPPAETIAILRACATAPSRAAAPVLVLADDGEKFGVWTNTHKLCYEDGWLDAFFAALEAESEWLRVRTFSEVLDRTQPRGRTYLPTASYAEMMEWALPPPAQRQLQRALQRVATPGAGADHGDHDADDLRLFVRGGFWRNFLAKYAESNWLHKRMLDTSRRVAAAAARWGDDHGAVRRGREALWKSQCNCGYWHGLFGGLYLPHLRGALYEQLLEAEAALATLESPPAFESIDLDADQRPEIILRNDVLQAFVKPDEGGAVFELDARAQRFNLLDLMTRREEAYHDRLRDLAAQEHGAGEASSTGPGAAVSIHDLVAVKEPGLERRLFYDVYRRGSFIDHALASEATIERFVDATLPELADLPGAPYPWARDGDALRCERTTALLLPGTPRLHVGKRLHLAGNALHADYELTHDGVELVEFVFAVELAVNFRAGDAPDRWFEVPGRTLEDRRLGSTGSLAGVQRIDAVDTWIGLRAVFETSRTGEVWRMPIETVSMSESGFERVYQGSALLFRFPLRLEPGQMWSLRVSQRVESP